jgi:hypothetical protein
MSNLEDLAAKAIAKMNKRITNEVFMLIQNDRELMQEYLKCVEDKGSQHVNQHIGHQVKKKYGLTNDTTREENPACTLIQSHQQFI